MLNSQKEIKPNRAQRRAVEAQQIDNTSSSKQTKAGKRMRAKAMHNFPKIIAYRDSINKLFWRAGIPSTL
ncbi:MAG: hypothetical protein V3V40_06440 [Nitrosomonadaceae bacterium]